MLFIKTILPVDWDDRKGEQRSEVCALHVEEIGHLGNDGAVGAAGEGVLLRAAEDVAQSVVVASFEDEVMPRLGAHVHAQSASDAVFKLLLHAEVVLRESAHKCLRHVVARTFSRRLADAEGYLWPYDKETFHSTSLTTEAKVGKKRHLHVVDGAAIGRACGFCLGDFRPSSLRII